MGRFLGSVIWSECLIAGLSCITCKIYGFYQKCDGRDVQLVSVVSDTPEVISLTASSDRRGQLPHPLPRVLYHRHEPALLTETYRRLEGEPRNRTGWFDCFDAAAIAPN